jgi:hypothetical protein
MLLAFARFYRYDFAVTQIFTDQSLSSRYYGISISAHLLSYTPTSVIQLLNETKKPFFIDPMTFAFARDLQNISRNGPIRRSYKKLMDDYGSPFSGCDCGINLMPSKFKKSDGTIDDLLIADVCKRVLGYQQNKCRASTGFAKYDKLLKKKGITLQPALPAFLVAPYFFASRYGSEWYEISLRFAEQAKYQKGNAELYPVICISQDVLFDETQVSNIVKDYEGFDGYLIWLDDLDEENLASDEICNLKLLISGLSAYGKPVYSLYGGYLCDLLSKFGLTGYSSGICYGEKRSVDAQGGGAGNRYYMPTVHVKISEDLANAFFAESNKNKNLMCNCPTCSNIRNTLSSSLSSREYADLFFSQMDFLDFRRHFINVKFQEMMDLSKMNKDEVAASLDKNIRTISDIDSIPSGHPSELTQHHLRIWRTLFD